MRKVVNMCFGNIHRIKKIIKRFRLLIINKINISILNAINKTKGKLD